MAANAAFVKAGATDVRAYQFPCYELVRIAARRTPRGFKRGKGGLEPLPGDDWPSRFVAAGGELYEQGTRMIAAKTSDVWQKLGDGAGGHTDTLGNPYAPFAFGSGYGLREVPREEALLIGVPFDGGIPQTLQMQLKAEARQYDPALLAKLEADLKRDDAKQTLSLSERARERARAAARAYQLKNRTAFIAALMNGRSGRLRGGKVAPTRTRSEAAKLGWETRRKRGWAPKRMKASRADKLLKHGFEVRDSSGNAVKFGQRLKHHIEQAPDAVARKEQLAWGRETVRVGIERGVFEKGQWRKRYSRLFHEGDKSRAFMVVVDVKAGEAFNIMRKDASWYRREHPQNRHAGGQSPVPVLRAHVTADRTPDYANHTILHARCKGLLNLLHGHV